MQEVIPLIRELAVLLGVASIAVLICQKLHQPIVLGYLVAGIIVGPHTPPYALVSNTGQIHMLSELGVIFLMFATGLEFSFHRLKQVGFSAVFTGLVEVLVTFGLGLGLGRLLHYGAYESLFLGAALSISSTTIIVKTFDELGLKGKHFTNIVFGALILEDLLAILILTSLSTILVKGNFLSLAMLWGLVKLIAVIGSWFFIGYFGMPFLFRKIGNYISEELLTILTIALCLGMAMIAANFNYSVALGAFIMGSILAETPFTTKTQNLITPLKDLFAAVFFVTIGMLIDPRNMWLHWPSILGWSLVIVVIRVAVTTVATFLSGQSLNTAIRAGFSMAPIGEFSFVIMSVGLGLKLVSTTTYQLVVGISALTTLFSTYLMRWSELLAEGIDQKLPVWLRELLKHYSNWVEHALIFYKKQRIYRKFILRLAINGGAIVLEFSLLESWALPYVRYFLHNNALATTCCWVLALGFAAPLVMGMLMSYRKLPKIHKFPALLGASMLVALEVVVLSMVHFPSKYVSLALVMILMGVFLLFQRNFAAIYAWLEKNFKFLFGKTAFSNATTEAELNSWHGEMTDITCQNATLLADDLTIEEFSLRFKVTVVAINRAGKQRLFPKIESYIVLGDILTVIGSAPMVAKCQEILTTVSHEFGCLPTHELFIYSVKINAKDSICGKSLADPTIKKAYPGLIVGILRSGQREWQPQMSEVVRVDDELLIASQRRKI